VDFNKHSNLIGEHSFLSGSKYHWINYTNEKLFASYKKYQAINKGIALHSLAEQLIRLGVKLPKSKEALNLFVNDAIGYHMTPEQPLYYSNNAFGTADAISFRKNFLRIHDLKTGVTVASIHQLEIYAALFCLEYLIRPEDIQCELRIYQSSEIFTHSPTPEETNDLMEKIVRFDKIIEDIKQEE